MLSIATLLEKSPVMIEHKSRRLRMKGHADACVCVCVCLLLIRLMVDQYSVSPECVRRAASRMEKTKQKIK